MPWDLASPRACVVNHPVLVQSPVPMLGTAAHATMSPLPYGVGAYSVDSAGVKKELPLYYVSPKAASKRERNVEAGLYVPAVPGQAFELRLTAVQAHFPSIDGKILEKNTGVNARIFVDGTRATKTRLNSSCSETIVSGFTLSISLKMG